MKTLKFLIHDFMQFIDFIRTYRFNKTMIVGHSLLRHRRKLCDACPLKTETKLFKFKRCGICGCFLNIKTKLRFEECPDEPPKWKMSL